MRHFKHLREGEKLLRASDPKEKLKYNLWRDLKWMPDGNLSGNVRHL